MLCRSTGASNVKYMTLPIGAICYDKQIGEYVWIASNGKANKVKIEKGDLLKDGSVAILNGLEGSENVIISGANFLQSGMEVVICE